MFKMIFREVEVTNLRLTTYDTLICFVFSVMCALLLFVFRCLFALEKLKLLNEVNGDSECGGRTRDVLNILKSACDWVMVISCVVED